MLAAAGDGRRDLRNRALLGLAYDTLCRRAELVALDLAELEAGAAGDATILIRRSKTDQEGVGLVRYIAPDTMRDLRTWLTAAGIEAGPIFRAVGKGAAIGGLDPGDGARVFKRMAIAAGLPPTEAVRISARSSRVGAAQDMVRYGLELPAVMQAGGWKTAEMFALYARHLDARRSGAVKLAVQQDRG